jgi:dTMP kinase
VPTDSGPWRVAKPVGSNPIDPRLHAAWSRGCVVALCGIDGSGKTTLIQGLADRLRSEGYRVHETRQPTDFYRTAQPVRDYHDRGESAMSEQALALLSAADRLLHLRTDVVPALEADSIVLTDRFLHATYAIFTARGVDPHWLAEINRYCPPPHVAILLDCPPEVAVGRIRARGGYIRLEERSIERLAAIRQSYLEVLRSTATVIDAREAPDKALAQSVDAVLSYLKRRASE